MLWSNRYFNCLNSLCALLLSSQPIVGTGFVPRDVAAGETIERRLCDPAAPDVSESSIVADFCNQTLTNDSPTCSDQVTVHIQQSATNTCGQYFGLFTDCLMANDGDHTACSDSLFGYQNCNNYTMQAYAYCGCYYTLPASLADCANEQLQPQPPDIAMVPTTSAPVTAIPDIVVSAASADKEPTPAVLAVSEGAASSSSQSTTSFSDPQPSSSPTAHILSFKWNMPSSNPGTAWTQIAAPSTSTERITVVVTYTTTFITAGYTTTAILTSTSISTEYTCADGGDVKIAVSAASVSAPTGSTPIVLAPIDPEIFTPYSAVVPTQSTGVRIAEGTTEQVGSQETSTSPSVAAPALKLGVGPSEATAGRTGSAVCTRCRRRSRIF